MTTIEDILKRYIEFYGLKVPKGKDVGSEIGPLFHYLLMDAGYCYFNKTILPLRSSGLLKHKLADDVNKWQEAYHDYFQTLFIVCRDGTEERDEMLEVMDRMEHYIADSLQITKYAAMDCFMNTFSMDQEEILGAALMSNMLSSMASATFTSAVPPYMGGGRIDSVLRIAKLIDATLKHSKSFAEMYMTSCGKEQNEVEPKHHDKLAKCVDALQNRMVAWLQEEARLQSSLWEFRKSEELKKRNQRFKRI